MCKLRASHRMPARKRDARSWPYPDPYLLSNPDSDPKPHSGPKTGPEFEALKLKLNLALALALLLAPDQTLILTLARTRTAYLPNPYPCTKPYP